MKKHDNKGALAEKISKVYGILDASYPEDIRFLPKFDQPWKFLFCVILSAQSTDERVKAVSVELFEKFPTLESFANADVDKLESIIKPVGLYAAKAKNLKICASQLLEFGRVPDNMDELITLAGVGRKTASCILGDVYSKPAVIVDTHFSRLMLRLGITDTRDAETVERQVKGILDEDKQYRLSMTGNLHARTVCKSRTPLCQNCQLSCLCPQHDYYKGQITLS